MAKVFHKENVAHDLHGGQLGVFEWRIQGQGSQRSIRQRGRVNDRITSRSTPFTTIKNKLIANRAGKP